MDAVKRAELIGRIKKSGLPSPHCPFPLAAAGELELLDSPRWVTVKDSTLELSFDLPRQGISLFEIGW